MEARMSVFRDSYGNINAFGAWLIAVGIVLAGSVLGVAAGFGIPAIARYQAVLNATNTVRVNEIVIAQQEQLIKVEEQKAQIRVAEAHGIAESQRIIDSSLTETYLQYLAIQAQRHMADSPNHTTVYIPSGVNGIPLVKTLPGER
jgi:hypothetical protein